MRLGLDIDWEDDVGEIRRVVAEVEYRLGRSAPRCSDPDHPDFSDPGDPDEIDLVRADYNDGTPVPKKIHDDERFIDALYDEARRITEGLERHKP